MAKKKTESDDQMDLIDVQPENAKAIISAARVYKKLQAARQAALEKEVEQKHKVIELIRAAHLQPLEGGKIKFEYDNVAVAITPRDELLTVKDKTDLE